jgi:hypothetical protein
MIPTPVEDNRSEIQKTQVKVIYEFFRLIQRILADYKCSILLSERNHGLLLNFINLVMSNSTSNFDMNTRRVTLTTLRALQVGLNEELIVKDPNTVKTFN